MIKEIKDLKADVREIHHDPTKTEDQKSDLQGSSSKGS